MATTAVHLLLTIRGAALPVPAGRRAGACLHSTLQRAAPARIPACACRASRLRSQAPRGALGIRRARLVGFRPAPLRVPLLLQRRSARLGARPRLLSAVPRAQKLLNGQLRPTHEVCVACCVVSQVSTQYACNQECRVLTQTSSRSLQSLCSTQMEDYLKRRQLMAQPLVLGVGPSPLPRRSPEERLDLARGALRHSAARARAAICLPARLGQPLVRHACLTHGDALHRVGYTGTLLK